MVDHVFSLFQTAGEENAVFPFPIREYQRYIFGDDKLAHRFGTDLAKALIAHGPGLGVLKSETSTSNQNSPCGIAVAVLTDYVPTATHSLRDHFVAYLNRYLIATNAKPTLKIDVTRVENGVQPRKGVPVATTQAYHIDRERLGGRTIIMLSDLRSSSDQEQRIKQSLQILEINNPIVFVYLASLSESTDVATLSPLLEFIVRLSIKDIESIMQSQRFTLNECFVQFLLGRDDVEFCQFLRRQDDCFARLLLDYAIGGRYYEQDIYQQNVKFLLWEVGVRESV